MTSLPHRLERTVTIRATREIVFRFFTDNSRWASWWGPGSTIDPRPGGQLLIRYPNGVEASGEVIEVAMPERIVFTYGYASGKPIPPGASRVTIQLDSHPAGTRVMLSHDFAEAAVRDEHTQGWRYQLSVFGNVVADEAHAGAAGLVDGWFQAWSTTTAYEREPMLLSVAAPDVRFRDRFGLIDGLVDLVPHIDAVQRFMPGLRLQRRGDIRHCQGTVLADWVGVGADGQERAGGTNVFLLGADGRIESVTGFWNAPARTNQQERT
jgi:uncharacterized protein YndB with AHSA1/START domain